MKKLCELKNDVIIIRLTGDLDHHITTMLRDEIDDKILKERLFTLAFDFKGVNFMDSSGIGLLMGRYKRIAPAGGCIYVCNLNFRMNRIFALSGLDKITRKSEEIDELVNREDTYEQY